MKMQLMLTVFNSKSSTVRKQGEINKLQNRAQSSYHTKSNLQSMSNRFNSINSGLTIECFYYNGIKVFKDLSTLNQRR